MMISPEYFAKIHSDESYVELILLREEIINEIHEFEAGEKSECEIMPGPDVRYKCNLLYLSELCKLIESKYNSVDN